MRKIVLDTSILMENPKVIEDLQDEYQVILHVISIKELDGLKTSKDQNRARKARIAIKQIYSNLERVRIIIETRCSSALDGDPDDVILSTALYEGAEFGTNDLNLKIKAKAIGVECADLKDALIYRGYREFYFTTDELNDFHQNIDKHLPSFHVNEYIIFRDSETNEVVDATRFDGKELVRLKLPPDKVVKAKNVLQRCALDMLNNKDIEICAILGGYGCVDMDTEYFNGYEWKKISRYSDGERVLEYDTNSKEAILSIPIDYVKLPCDEFYKFSNKLGVSQLLSEEHSMIYQYPRNDMKRMLVKDVLEQHKTDVGFVGKFITTFNYHGTGVYLDQVSIDVISDFMIHGIRYDLKQKVMIFGFKKSKEADEYCKYLDYHNIKHSSVVKNKDGYTVCVSADKRISYNFYESLYNLESEQLEYIFDRVNKSLNHKYTIFYKSNSKLNVDFMQFLYASMGLRTSVIEDGQYYKLKSYNTTRSSFVSKRDGIEKVTSKDGFKYCFTMPTSNLVLRRDGHIFITGNSGKTFLALKMALDAIDRTGAQSSILGVREPAGEGKEIGYLKGDYDDKTMPFFAPLVQSMDGGEREFEDKIQRGQLDTQIPYYMKGTTYNSTIIVCDEAEDLSERQIRLVGTRLGRESRIFFSGDYKQGIFDATKSNPLVRLCQELKGNPRFACIFLEDDVRSEASKLFADLYNN